MSISGHAKPATTAPTTSKGGENSTSLNQAKSNVQRQFVQMALNMMWQLAVVFLLPVVVGAQLDKALDTNHVLTYVGLGLGAVGSVWVIWRSMQIANRLPVPKLTAAQKRAVQKSYEEDDE